jgi:predicted secreted acid phosphatase
MTVYDTAYRLGKNYIHHGKFAVMFDIDDTLLNTRTMKGIKPIIHLLHECNKKGLFVLIVTARDSVYTDQTIQDLLNIGIREYGPNITVNTPYYNYLYLRQSPQDDHQYFKSDIKKYFAKHGLFTVMSVGDNYIDVIGEYSGFCLKLPNQNDPNLYCTNIKGKLVPVTTDLKK